ncbi:MAG TPA: PEP-CTERM sorting domain-containing protein [Terriglobales bacterium]|nr:PEP-CTERM sorting domain-containing protein [Terriglobales bacterium]
MTFYRSLLGLAAACGLLALGAGAQTTITLTSSGSNLVTFSSTGNGTVDATLGNCSNSQCTLTGGAEGTFNGSAVSGYTINLGQLTPLTNNGGGSFSVSAADLAGSSFDLSGASGTVFSGAFTALNFTDTANDTVAINATVQGSGSSSGTTINIKGSIQLDGANVEAVANSPYPVAVSGGIVPEPTTLLLFGTGLLCLGGLMRRRLGAMADGESV